MSEGKKKSRLMFSFLHNSSQRHVPNSSQNLPRIHTDTYHGKGLHVLLTVLLELTGNDDANTFHIVNPAFIRSPAQTQDTMMERRLRKNQLTNTMKRNRHARPVEALNTLLHWQFGIAEQSLWRSCATCWLLNIPDCPATFPVPPYLLPHAKSNVPHHC